MKHRVIIVNAGLFLPKGRLSKKMNFDSDRWIGCTFGTASGAATLRLQIYYDDTTGVRPAIRSSRSVGRPLESSFQILV